MRHYSVSKSRRHCIPFSVIPKGRSYCVPLNTASKEHFDSPALKRETIKAWRPCCETDCTQNPALLCSCCGLAGMKHEGLIAGFQRTRVLNSRGDRRWRGLTQSSSQQMTPVLGDVSKWCPSKGYISTDIVQQRLWDIPTMQAGYSTREKSS